MYDICRFFSVPSKRLDGSKTGILTFPDVFSNRYIPLYGLSGQDTIKLNNDPRFEARVSRPTPTTVLGTTNATSLRERVRMANEWPADYFISIHCNSNPNPAVNGTEVYIYQYGTQSNWLAAQVMNGVTQTVGTKNNGIRVNQSLYVLRRTNMPSILVELGYLSNISDAQKLRDNQRQFAYGIFLGFMRYFGFA
jgi:N-acetylmuramoyl-L-alanine amidase